MRKLPRYTATMDYWILVLTLILVAYGLLMVFSASYYKASASAIYDYDGLYLFKRQAMGALAGTAVMIIMAFMDYHLLLKFKYPILILSIVLLLLIFVPGIGVNLNGATRWIRIPPLPQMQPAEIAKFAVIVMVASNIFTNRRKMTQFHKGILPNILILGIMCLLLYRQPNFSCIILLCVLVFIMMYVGGASGWQLLLLAGVVGAVGFMLMMNEDYRVRRVLTFADPWQDPQGDGHQVIQSLYGIGAGGLTGKGLGNSLQKFLWLPYGESDFIFAITAEELGFLGVAALILLFILLIYRGIKTASMAPDLFGTMMACGITTLIGVQALMNIAVATASMPATGVPMPLFSYGSSSLIVFMGMIGILLNISRQRRKIRVPAAAVEPTLRPPAPPGPGPRKLEVHAHHEP